MLILLAESKTMGLTQENIEPGTFLSFEPPLENMADDTMEFISTLSSQQISDVLGVSSQLASKVRNLAYEFPNKTLGYKALFGFTGEAYKGLDASALTGQGLKNAITDIRIISSVYGYLRADNIIKPYRLEFNKNCAPDFKNMAKHLKSKVTIQLVNEIKNTANKDVINLLPADAELCVDWKIVRAFAKVHKICFKAVKENGNYKTPIASRLKELRGIMARTISERNIKSFNDLIKIDSEHFMYSEKDSKPGLPVFLCTE